MKPLFTIGYSRLPLSRLVEIVSQLDALVVDVRRYPRSWNPDFCRDKLQATFGKQYSWRGDVLGGYGRVSPAGIAWIREEREGRTLLLLCVEHNPLDCHRHADICARFFPDAIHIVGEDRILASDLEAKLC